MRKPLHERFWSKVERSDTCWIWKGATKKPWHGRSGGSLFGGQSLPHGVFRVGAHTFGAHRVSFAIENVEGFLSMTPDEQEEAIRQLPLIGHECDVPQCVRPACLKLSDHSTNLQESYDRGRREAAALDELLGFFGSVAAE